MCGDLYDNSPCNVNYTIKDSGNIRSMGEGLAVRDMAEGKGRFDLTPLDVVAEIFRDHEGYPFDIFLSLEMFMRFGNKDYLISAIKLFADDINMDLWTLCIEVSKHYENGCKKYGDRNWEKGMPLHVYIDSATRHYCKHMRGDRDEPHHLAFVWNLFGAIWTNEHKPELNDLPFGAK